MIDEHADNGSWGRDCAAARHPFGRLWQNAPTRVSDCSMLECSIVDVLLFFQGTGHFQRDWYGSQERRPHPAPLHFSATGR
jgi:hypothetical protein